MKYQTLLTYLLSILIVLLMSYGLASAALDIPGGEILQDPSINIPVERG
jgi:hypothetical protein